MAKKDNDTPKEEEKDKGQEILKSVLKPGTHFNDIVPKDYSVSTGSLNLDLGMGGGIKPSIIRISGMAEAGKTSFSLNVIKNFLEEKSRKRRSVYFLSDKELSINLVNRCGVKFVETIDEFVDGTCFIIRTNIYETVCNTIKKLLAHLDTEYAFVLDSMDNFSPQSALEADFGESFAKGGTSAISAHFFRCFNILLPRLGHIAIMISQFRDTVIIGKSYQPTHKQTNSSGGRAIEHAVSWAFEFLIPLDSKEDMFWEGAPYKSKKIGHNCIVHIKKSINETTGTKIKYPIIYGRENGKSIYIEKEILDQLLIWDMVKVKASWFVFETSVLSELKKIDPEIPEKIQGEGQFVTYLESKPDITDYLYKKFRKILSKHEAL
jgi:RecA/RadA recombinase